MQFGINLLPTKKPALGEKRAWRRLKILAGAVLASYIIFIGALVFFSLFISFSQRKLKQEVGQVEAKIKALEKRESQVLTIKGRAELANKILGERVSQKELLSRVQNLSLVGISLFEINMAPGKLNFSGEAQNALVLGDFLDRLSQTTWSWVRLASLARTSKGVYSFSLETNPILK